ncbi:hybrid sensor histidine kinase/response regulator [Parathalassolituus penaei]|uniref:Chemotaxis protein CheA n=1 Tax=Parathalassolituus penaei TaxID=2997323 RepID=A0A9X3ITY1_9GAMM|nr:response regulator [Parathalassolituus penaei]MCY0966369.1 Hpt domain-containing protein [Parathalassolituus penaei]
MTEELLVEEPLVLEQQPSDLIADELVYDLPVDNSELLLQEPVTEELLVEEPLVLEQQPSDLIADELVYDLSVDNSELLLQEPVIEEPLVLEQEPSELVSEELVYDLPYDINSLMSEPVDADDVTLSAEPAESDDRADDALTLDVSFDHEIPVQDELPVSAQDMLLIEEPAAEDPNELVVEEPLAIEPVEVNENVMDVDGEAFDMPDTAGFNLNDVMAAHMAGQQPISAVEVESEPEFIAPASEPVASYQADSEHDAEVDEILEIFLEEAEEIIESVERTLNDWRDDPENLVSVARLQRDLHTLKGGARMAEQPAVAELCHELETLYERINNGRLGVESGLFNLLQAAHDDLGGQLDAIRHGDKPASAASIMATLSAYMSGDSSGLANISALAPASAPVVEAVAPVEPEIVHTPEVITAPVAAADQIFSESLDEADREILEIFLEEAQELQEALEKTLHDWKSQPEERDAAAETQRVLHTLKGGARLAGLMDLGNLAHDFETDITHVLQGSRLLDDAFFDLAYQRQDAIVRRIEEVARIMASGDLIMLNSSGIETTGHESNPALPEVTALAVPQVEVVPQEAMPSNVVSLRPQAAAPARVAEETAVAVNAPASLAGLSLPDPMANRKAPQELVKVSADLLDDLVNLAGETSIGRGRLEQQVTDFAHTLEEMEMTLDRLRDQLRRLDIETEAQVLFRQERQGPAYEDFDPLEMDRYSTMQQLSRALVESASDLLDLKDTLANKTRDAETLLLQQSRINTELQEGLMKTRMVPFQRLVPRLRRIVRQISQELDKQVDFRVVNADGELDRTILERMISPLEHMVRNAVDHGIEMPVDRMRNGKNEMGIIELAVTREGGDVVLTLSDDGRGVNREAVRRKAIERGLLEPNAQVDDYELMQFILQAGFSTAKNVTQISGRGVGLDVVSTEIKQMGGAVEIQSVEGQGTRFVVRLPFTVSVNRALMVRTGDDLYAVPLNNIQGIVRVSVNDLQEFYSRPRAERGYRYGGRDYRLEYLGVMLENESQPKVAAQNLPLPVLLVNGAVPYALQVDSVLGSREIVVKALGPQFAAVMGVSGGTILGDGSVVIILDLPAMIRAQATLEYQQAKLADRSLAEQRQEKSRRQARVLVVDDSVTVRKVTTRLLERHGFEVLTASDGVDAMATLQDHKPDVMLLDIEMPRMDGFEVASLVRHDSRLRDIPIIMITSRTGDKHRDRAMSIGVNEYMGKPFQEDNLLGALNKLLGREER